MEGLTLDLTKIPSDGTFVLDDIIVPIEERPKKVRTPMTACSGCEKRLRCREHEGSLMCFLCYTMKDVSMEVVDFIRGAYNKPCEFCYTHGRVMHYDHKNMFIKRETIPNMVHLPIHEIQEEIEVCQLLCVQCHAKVTAAEWRHGFMMKKKTLNKRIRVGDDVNVLLQQYIDEYDEIMQQEYIKFKYEGFWRLFSGDMGDFRGASQEGYHGV